jgi:hypothetical protein
MNRIRGRLVALAVCVTSVSCAELLGIESATVDGGVDALADAPFDAGQGSDLVHCGDGSCGALKPVCCFGMTPISQCEASEAAAANFGAMCSTALHCDDQAQCGDSGVCCLTMTADGSVSECSASCSGSIMCDPDADGGCDCSGSITFKGVSYSLCVDP